MRTSVALLRGINVGGRNLVPMAGLRALFEHLGYAGVRTYLQSGNVLFDSPTPPDPEVIRAALRDRFGVDGRVVLRGGTELAAVVAANPFGALDPKTLHVGFCPTEIEVRATAGVDHGAFAPEEAVADGAQLYFHLPDGMGRAKLPAYLDRRLGGAMTVRNWNTVTKLAELTGS